MELRTLSTCRGRSSTDVHGMYPWLFWPIELIHNYNLVEELNREDIWCNNDNFKNNQRYCADIDKSILLKEFCNEFNQLKNYIIDIAGQYPEFQCRWYKDNTYYKEKLSMFAGINKDVKGFTMAPHLDNSHVIVQIIVNLIDNTSGTELYEFDNVTPTYTMSSKCNQGVMFFNGPGAVHGIQNVTKNRYTLYSAVVYN